MVAHVAADLTTTIELIRPSVFQVRITDSANPLASQVLGTAFLVSNDGWLVTAKHVVDTGASLMTLPTHALSAAFAIENIDTPALKMRANFIGTSVTVASTDAENDLALLHLDKPPAPASVVMTGDGSTVVSEPAAVTLAIDRPMDGEPVAVSGYPLNEAALVTNVGVVASSWAWDDSNHNDRFLGDFTANPGNSGAPVYRVADGGVIGVCVGGKLTPVVGGVGQHAAALTIVVPSVFVAALLDSIGVRP